MYAALRFAFAFRGFCADDSIITLLRLHLRVLITYAQGSRPELQRQVAERLANEAVHSESGLPFAVPVACCWSCTS